MPTYLHTWTHENNTKLHLVFKNVKEKKYLFAQYLNACSCGHTILKNSPAKEFEKFKNLK